MKRIVLDTNVLFSGLIRPESPPDWILLLLFNREAELCLSEEIFSEYAAVLRREKFRAYLPPGKVERLLNELRAVSTLLEPPPMDPVILDDPSDDKFLACALAGRAGGRADFLITGNRRHFSFKKFHQTRIVSPARFVDLLLADTE